MKHPDGRMTVIPMHRGEMLGRGILRKIARDVRIDRDRLLELLEDA